MPTAHRAPVGVVTRGTTNPNRLRRVDRYLAGPLAGVLRSAEAHPTVVDLGYGAKAFTAIELHERLLRVRPDVRLLGLEIEPARVAAAQSFVRDDRRFERGGFEVPLPQGWSAPVLIRAFNVLRQYDEAEVAAAWARMGARLGPGGRLVEGTCDELGRLASWVTLSAGGPLTLTVSMKLSALERPSDVAERLPKALIHRNVPGEPVHAFLAALDRAWEVASPLRTLGPRQRFLAAATALQEAGHPLLDGPRRWRLGEMSVPWSHVTAS